MKSVTRARRTSDDGLVDLMVQSKADPRNWGFASFEIAKGGFQVDDVRDTDEIFAAPTRGKDPMG